MTRTWDTLVAPSASSTICSASEMQTSLSAAVRVSSEGVAPRPLASTRTVSLVEVHPSTVMALKDASTAARSAVWRVAGSTAASVVHRASMVAMLGASMAAPLAMAPTVIPLPRTRATFSTVSVVMMARAAAAPASGPPARPSTMRRMCGCAVSRGNGMPISPVWQTKISSGEAPTASAVDVHSAKAASRPGSPVAALALPEVRMTPAARPAVAARWARLTWTGAAAARLAVNTPAAGTARPSSVATTATSGTPPALIPADPPAATKPSGAVTLTGTARRWAVRSSRAGPGPRWRTAPPGPRRP